MQVVEKAPVVDYEINIVSGRRRVIVAFAGGDQDKFQFKVTLKRLGVAYVLFRDSTQRYYHKGINGIGGREHVLDFLRQLKLNWEVTTVGVSSGAYAALLYGQLAPVHKMIAISPLTGRDVDDFDPRWHAQIIDPNIDPIPDLRQFFKQGPVPDTVAFVSNGEATELDVQMSTRIGITKIALVPGFAHGKLAQGMRDMGLFDKLFADPGESDPDIDRPSIGNIRGAQMLSDLYGKKS